MRPHLPGLGLLVGALLASSACSPSDAPPGAVTADEAQQLNDAAAMLDQNSVELDQINAETVPNFVTNQGDPPR